MVLFSLLSAAVLPLTISAHPHPPSHFHFPRGNGTGACGKIEQFYNPTPDIWKAATTDEWLNNWWTKHQGEFDSAGGFAHQFGNYALGEPLFSCKDSSTSGNCDVQVCGNPKINSLGPDMDKAFYVVSAVTKLQGFLLGMKETFGTTVISTAMKKENLAEYFYKTEGLIDGELMREMVNIIVTLVGVFAAGAGEAVGAAAGIAASVAGGAGTAAFVSTDP